MKVGKGYAGFEPIFAVGVLAAALASLSISQIYNAGAIVLGITVGLIILLIRTQSRHPLNTPEILIAATALAAGMFCGLNGRLVNYPTGSGRMHLMAFQYAGEAFQASIDAINFTDRDTNALLKALLSGNRADLPHRITEAFRISGASHILALSGLHLGIIYAIADKATAIMGNSRKTRITRSISNITICTFYTLATGASTSITRALLFIILREAGILSGRPVRLNVLLRKCLLIHLALDPCAILDIGFQLSYAAMAGIAWIYPPIKNIWHDENPGPMKRIWDSASLTISCQLTTAPLVLHYFGTFPTHFLLTNLLALPLTGFLVPIAILTVTLSAADLCPAILTEVCEKAASCLISVLETISLM